MPGNVQGDVGLSRQARSIWGKTNRQDDDWWLPLYAHMADSIAMAERIWDHWTPDGTKAIVRRSIYGQRDVAASATAEPTSQVVERDDLARKTYLLLAGIHDIGKATPIFQIKPIRYTAGIDGNKLNMAWLPEHAGLPIDDDFVDLRKPTHPIAGQIIVERYLCERHTWDETMAQSYASVIGGHHGTPPSFDILRKFRDGFPKRLGHDLPDSTAWLDVQYELIDFVIRRIGMTDHDLDILSTRFLHPCAASILTGLVIMADWIASDSDDDRFPLVPTRAVEYNGDDIHTWEGLNRRADRAWRSVGLSTPWNAPQNDIMDETVGAGAVGSDAWFRSRFRLPEGAIPRPMQREAVRLASTTDEPGLMIIEAPMGEGKTEAALAAAEILARRTGRGGVCVALPTMATTDAMFGRVHTWMESLPHDGERDKTVWLAHGKAQLNEEFRGVIASSRRGFSSIDSDPDDSGQRPATFRRKRDVPPETVVSDWMWGRKKGVLANFLICTIDQVLMGALEMKHVVLRQLALANKVVVIDECHAYDAYMQEYLKRILEWLGGFGAPVVLLSATLPESQRQAMTGAYLKGRSAVAQNGGASNRLTDAGRTVMPKRGRWSRAKTNEFASAVTAADAADGTSRTESMASAYPLITYTQGATVRMLPVAPSGRSSQVTCRMCADDDATLTSLVDRLTVDGGCIGVICDTVARAQHAADLLARRYGADTVKLTHARFMDLDRMANETELRDLLGPQSTVGNGKRPHRLIVVGTQVLEQSLDIDFDALITDIAPVDLIMQRLGRVHRHHRGEGESDRPESLRRAQCFIRGVKAWHDDGPRFAGSVTLVYPEASLMEALGVLGLTDDSAGCDIRLPEDIARTVRLAYGSHAESVIAAGWRNHYADAVKRRAEQRDKKHNRASTCLMTSLAELERNQGTLTDWFTPRIDETDDDKGPRAVRDTQESVEVLLLRRTGDDLRLLPWIGDERHGIDSGARVPTDIAPDDDLAVLISQCAVRLPVSMCRPDRIDYLITVLERDCIDDIWAWQDSPWLAGRLAIILDEETIGGRSHWHATVEGFDVRYSPESGLAVSGENQ
ncbi:CRISPR-associated endonuclease Cas3'' [Bifidobacterium samirii]|uniref:CRISPR-associated helicase Cas3 n=1 Tax=Bifidobacterium samirii TaxID=2306974 RepID=A0A430FW61_9BIFI|nr:CRISPR-associated endonuclease Cas3'' [Bifidobacterium samirii]RSX58168.1 CRISPR-associated helicase Cas3 [Bifidobacterium samirii]